MKRLWFPCLSCLLIWSIPLTALATVISGGGKVVQTQPTSTVDPQAVPGEEVAPNEAQTGDEITLKIRHLLHEASINLKKRDFAAANALIDQAELLRPDNPDIFAARGALYTATGNYDQAREIYQELQKLQPTELSPQFNLAQLAMLEKNYDRAYQGFKTAQNNFPNSELLRFKIIVACLLLNNESEAQQQIDLYKLPSDTAAYYFAHAAMDLFHKNLPSAKNWMISGARVFGGTKTAIYFQALLDSGLLTASDLPPV